MPSPKSASTVELLEEYTVVNTGNRFNTRAYYPAELNQVIYAMCNENSIFVETLSKQREDTRGYRLPSGKLNIFQQAERKIVLFSVVNGSGKNRSYQGLDSLGNALRYYTEEKQEHEIGLDNTVLIIPVAEALRNHYRLLVITKDGIHYYDSKNSLVTNVVGASISAAITTFMAADDALAAVSESAAADNEEDKLSAKALKFMGTFAEKAPAYYAQYRHPVLEICKKYFPPLPAEEISLGDQFTFNFSNCGPLVAAYAKLVVTKQPMVLKDAIDDIRRSHRWGSEKEMFETLIEKPVVSGAELPTDETPRHACDCSS